jgi:hypothetical protein
MQSLWILALLLVPATALVISPKKSAQAKISAAPKDIPTNLISKGHCGLRLARNSTKVVEKKVSLLAARNPGAGSDKSEVEADLEAMTQHKDGYYYVGCVGDRMMKNADKHGDQGSHRYAGGFADVSIVWYHDFTPKEDRVAMTSEVCFDFCSTIKSMGYFGLAYGRECYCTPYYREGSGATGNCDSPCEGLASEMCGNQAGRANVYQMHSCANAEE